MSSLVGGRIPYFKKGMVCFIRGYLLARAARSMHHPETNANCTRVRVMGFGSAVRMALDEVLEKMDVIYQIPHSVYRALVDDRGTEPFLHTMSLGESGAFRASASSWAFWLTLAFLPRMVLMASLKLFCLPCLLAGAGLA